MVVLLRGKTFRNIILMISIITEREIRSLDRRRVRMLYSQDGPRLEPCAVLAAGDKELFQISY